MIKIESLEIAWLRGIATTLSLHPERETFVISGPNGSGKSAVVDAIEFALTGQMGRLTGPGTKGLSVTAHGPHVDQRESPDVASVKVRLFIPELDKSATITRRIKSPKKPVIQPADDDVKAVLAEMAEHPEITLSRRDIVRLILIEPGKRSDEIQALLKLDQIGKTRSVLNTAQNRLQTSLRTATAQVRDAADALRLHFQITDLSRSEILAAVNDRRAVLKLPDIRTLEADTDVTAGLSTQARTAEPNKGSALLDMHALSSAIDGFPELCAEQCVTLIRHVEQLEGDPYLLTALQRHSLLETGLHLVDGPACPLCDTQWPDEQQLRDHLQAKLAKAGEAKEIEESLRRNGSTISDELTAVVGLIERVRQVARAEGEEEHAMLLHAWQEDLENVRPKLVTVDGVLDLKERLRKGWLNAPAGLPEALRALEATVSAKPDQTATIDAQTFLATAQVRLCDHAVRRREEASAKTSATRAAHAYETYCAVAEEILRALYDRIESDFSRFYRELNGDDESNFSAQLIPAEGRLDLDVDFYERGLFAPAAYHSEGHQDGMGVCLYLALMKHLFGDRFTLALLDDVMMSIDSGHRSRFCSLLKRHFQDTQFLVTTHDRVWAAQMKSAGLVTAATSMVFHGWTIAAGPVVESSTEVWNETDQALAEDRVETAAATLRRHLEYVSRELADRLGASARFRADGNYDLGELLPSVLAQMDKLLGKAANAAQSWKQLSLQGTVVERRCALSDAKKETGVAEWAVNPAVHYNEWANFSRNDFEPVVEAFKVLLEQFRCDACSSWLYVIPERREPESLRCACAEINWNLKAK